jgi:hypothetical protein
MSTLVIINLTAEPVLVQELYATVPASGTLETQRTAAQIQAMPNFLASVAAGDLSYSLTADSAAESVATEGAESMRDLGVPAAASATAVHAGFAGNDASNDYPGPFTDPDVPRNVTATFAASWDGGDVTVVGTDQFGAAQSEVLASNAGGSTTGAKVFKTVTSATKGAVGSAADTASIGTGTVLGLGVRLLGLTGNLLFADGVGEAGTWDVANSSVDPTTAPNASVAYVAMVKLS